MTSSAVAVSPSLPKPSTSVLYGDDDEFEYEEIEEEIEVEEEIEGGEDDSEIGEDLTPVREEKQDNDTNENMEPVEHEECMQDTWEPGISVSKPLTNIPTILSTSDPRTSDNVVELVVSNGERTFRDHEPKVPHDASGGVNGVKGKLFVGDAASTMINTSTNNDEAIGSVVAEPSCTAVEAVEEIEQISPRFHFPRIRLRDSSPSTEFDVENKRLRIICEFHAKGWCIKGNSCRFLHVKERFDASENIEDISDQEAGSNTRNPPQQSGSNPLWNFKTEILGGCRSDELGGTLVLADRESHDQKSCLVDYKYYTAPKVKGSLIDCNTYFNANTTGCSLISPDNHHKATTSTFRNPTEQLINQRSDTMNFEVLSTNISYSHSKQSIFSGLSSRRTDALGAGNLLKNNVENLASVASSLKRSTSSFSGSETEGLSQKRSFRDTELATCKVKIFSDDWEPSVPFCPSHFITRNLLLKERLYDPIRDSIEPRGALHKNVEFSHSDRGSPIKDVHLQSKTSREEEKLLNSNNVVKTVRGSITSSSCDDKRTSDKSRQKAELKIDGSGNETADLKREINAKNESDVFRYFQAALIDFVKELVKPKWRGGLLSKDAHKMIVKKSVDKVLSTLRVQQIPSTPESIKLYLSSSQPKLAKLVEGYIEKYGKS